MGNPRTEARPSRATVLSSNPVRNVRTSELAGRGERGTSMVDPDKAVKGRRRLLLKRERVRDMGDR